jgi:hypothetical protein
VIGSAGVNNSTAVRSVTISGVFSLGRADERAAIAAAREEHHKRREIGAFAPPDRKARQAWITEHQLGR